MYLFRNKQETFVFHFVIHKNSGKVSIYSCIAKYAKAIFQLCSFYGKYFLVQDIMLHCCNIVILFSACIKLVGPFSVHTYPSYAFVNTSMRHAQLMPTLIVHTSARQIFTLIRKGFFCALINMRLIISANFVMNKV